VDTKILILVTFLAQLDVAFAKKIVLHQLSGNASQTVCVKSYMPCVLPFFEQLNNKSFDPFAISTPLFDIPSYNS
jgi:hypothetical protein